MHDWMPEATPPEPSGRHAIPAQRIRESLHCRACRRPSGDQTHCLACLTDVLRMESWLNRDGELDLLFEIACKGEPGGLETGMEGLDQFGAGGWEGWEGVEPDGEIDKDVRS